MTEIAEHQRIAGIVVLVAPVLLGAYIMHGG
jgi:hypothetical protein